MYHTSKYKSPLGEIILASSDEVLVGLWFTGQKYIGDIVNHADKVAYTALILEDAKAWLDNYFAGRSVPVPPFELIGTPFRCRVWKALLSIPYGKTDTYAGIANRIGCRSAQAVGGAVAHNPLSIIVPCHRVIGSNGALIGYAGGINRKKQLLEFEHAHLKQWYADKK